VPGARPGFKHNEAFIFQIATDDQQETNGYWNAIVGMAAKRAAMIGSKKIDIATIKTARRGCLPRIATPSLRSTG
jgi:hypothetical protein